MRDMISYFYNHARTVDNLAERLCRITDQLVGNAPPRKPMDPRDDGSSISMMKPMLTDLSIANVSISNGLDELRAEILRLEDALGLNESPSSGRLGSATEARY